MNAVLRYRFLLNARMNGQLARQSLDRCFNDLATAGDKKNLTHQVREVLTRLDQLELRLADAVAEAKRDAYAADPE